MPDLRKLMADMDKLLVTERKRARDDLPTMLDLVDSLIKISNFEDVSILDDFRDLDEKIKKALQ
jgi:hypothetical protein